jgi:hypothetical protein
MSFNTAAARRNANGHSPRQLPTDHDYAVSTREYQSDHQLLKPRMTDAESPGPKRDRMAYRRGR